MSRNDPPVHVERLGPRRRLILVSSVFDRGDSPDVDTNVSATAMVLASGALVWEMMCEQGVVDDEAFGWGVAMRDVLLSLASQVDPTSRRHAP